MTAIGAKYKLREGKILHASRLWKAPSKRRIPRIMIEDRAMEVGILIYLEEPWMVFEETKIPSEKIDSKEGIMLVGYFKKYHLLPATFQGMDTYKWLSQSGKALLLWGKENHYFVKKALH